MSDTEMSVETAIGRVNVTACGGRELYVRTGDRANIRETVKVRGIDYTLTARLHVASDGTVSNMYLDENTRVKRDRFELMRVNWLATPGMTWDKARASASATEKAHEVVRLAIAAAISPEFILAGERASRAAKLARAADRVNDARRALAEMEAEYAAIA